MASKPTPPHRRSQPNSARFQPGHIDDPETWNATWEAQTLESSTAVVGTRLFHYDDQAREGMLTHYCALFRDLYGVQRVLAALFLAELELNRSWQSSPKTARREHMLQGHVRAYS